MRQSKGKMSAIEIFQQLYSMGMWRWSVTVAAFVTFVPIVAAQDRPKISLALPVGTVSEAVQIEYFLTGPFGGYGGFVRAEKKRTSYDIEPFVDDRPADDIKIIVYLPGCEIAALDLAFSGTPVEQRLDCYPLSSFSFRGQVLHTVTTQDQNREIEVIYLAMWSHRFFGISD